MITLSTVAFSLGGSIGLNELGQRADRFRKEAEYHRRMEREAEAKTAYWEALSGDPSRESDLPLALFRAGRWSKGQALEMELESLDSPSGPRWGQLAAEAKGVAEKQAQRYRGVSEYHARQKWRYDRVAFSPWLSVGPDPPPP